MNSFCVIFKEVRNSFILIANISNSPIRLVPFHLII